MLVEKAVGKAGEAEGDRSQYFVGLPNGAMLMANRSTLFRWSGKKGQSFGSFAELGDLGGAIKNIAVSADGTQLAFSVTMDRIPQAPAK